MGFHEVRFPVALSFGSSGGPERRTEIVTLTNGYEERNTPWEHSRRRYDAGIGLRSLADLDAVITFFEARRGQLYGFRWKDWSDWTSGVPGEGPGVGDQQIGTGDGATRVFQLSKTYEDTAGSYRRPIRKPVEGSVRAGTHGCSTAGLPEWCNRCRVKPDQPDTQQHENLCEQAGCLAKPA
jgi:uncharacterized protein (TIGR02217 family)